MEYFFDFLGIAIGLSGFLYAVLTNRQKAKMETMVRIHLSGIAGDVKEIRENTKLSWSHFDIVTDNAIKLDSCEFKDNILKSSQLGSGNSAAAHRMLGNLLNYVLNTQEGMFNTTEIRYPTENNTVS